MTTCFRHRQLLAILLSCGIFLASGLYAHLGSATIMAPPVHQTDDELFQAAANALEESSPELAIRNLELLLDRGKVGVNASYNLASAYLRRASTEGAQPGDLGRAVAALEQGHLLDPRETEMQRLAERARVTILRERSQLGRSPVQIEPSLGHALTSLLEENSWVHLALAGALALTFGLVGMIWSRASTARLSGAIASAMGALCLIAGTAGALNAREFRLGTEVAVVITVDARVLDEQGRSSDVGQGALRQSSIPEGSRVYIQERIGNLTRVLWGSDETWLHANALRILKRP